MASAGAPRRALETLQRGRFADSARCSSARVVGCDRCVTPPRSAWHRFGGAADVGGFGFRCGRQHDAPRLRPRGGFDHGRSARVFFGPRGVGSERGGARRRPSGFGRARRVTDRRMRAARPPRCGARSSDRVASRGGGRWDWFAAVRLCSGAQGHGRQVLGHARDGYRLVTRKTSGPTPRDCWATAKRVGQPMMPYASSASSESR